MRLALRSVAGLAAGLLGGCVVYPEYKTTFPQARVVVRDEAGLPVVAARVVLVSQCLPNCLISSKNQMTDGEGRVSFASEAEWRAAAPLMIHGTSDYRWHWCVEKAGYVTYQSELAGDFAPDQSVVLKRGASRACSDFVY